MSKGRVRFAIALAMVCLVLVALILASCNSSTATTTTAAPAGSTTTASQASGGTIDAAALYATNCSGCHKNVPGASAAGAKSVIENGKESMPSFTDKLSADEIAALATYVSNGGK
jgi:mono/diheme cytochrome c family protein